MRPPKRQKKNVETVDLTSGVRMWTLEDLKALLKALKRFVMHQVRMCNIGQMANPL